MEILKVILLAIGLVGIAMAGLALNILVKKGGKFPNTHISGNKYLKQNGIYCAQTQDKIDQASAYKKVDFDHVVFAQDKKLGK
ncbi:MAG: hypothetical protein IPF54_13325 [Draconibacterium sp.]|nr:hypothetical protein [Draconibacterium sp.]